MYYVHTVIIVIFEHIYKTKYTGKIYFELWIKPHLVNLNLSSIHINHNRDQYNIYYT